MRDVSFRALGIGLVSVFIVCWIVAQAELVTGQIMIGFLQFPAVAIGMLVFFRLGSSYIRTLSKRFGLSPQDLMTIYTMMVLAAMISSRGLMEKLVPALPTANYFANVSNNWQKIFWPYLKKWLIPWDPHGDPQQKITQRFFEGLRFGEHVDWKPWIGPMLAWMVLVVLVFSAFLCLASLLRRQWVDNEKLNFPLVQLPLEMARDEGGPGGLFKSRLMWIGFAIPAAIFTLNGLHKWYPVLPEVLLTYDLNQYLTTRPWSDVFYTPIWISFAAIGFFYFLPTELLLSLWFFFLFSRVQDVIMSSFGMTMDAMPMYPTHLFMGYQVAGAYLVLAGYFLMTARPHMKTVLAAVFLGHKVDDSQELLPYPVAFWGLVVSFAGAVVWWWMAGMSLWLAAFELGIYIFVIALVLARSVAEGGMLMTETSFRPIDLYSMLGQRAALGPQNLTLLALMDAIFLRDQRGLILSGFLDGLKIADGVQIRRRSFLITFGLAIISTLIIASIIQIRLPYEHHGGGLNMYGYAYQANNQWGFQDYAAAAQGTVQHYDWRAPVFFLVGVAFTLFLSFMRINFSWWPLHPLGYALCASWSMIVFWFPALIAWIIKGVIQRYGGMRVYMQARPFFLGLILGEFILAIIWALLSTWLQIPAPQFPWP
ncbi:MAG: hypothetical protein M3Y56_07460 [Armatimonadota bacterium]|nr:hypothetical protein [Armatimonadota bacterium]